VLSAAERDAAADAFSPFASLRLTVKVSFFWDVSCATAARIPVTSANRADRKPNIAILILSLFSVFFFFGFLEDVGPDSMGACPG